MSGSSYPAENKVPWVKSRVKYGKCGGRGNKIDVRRTGRNSLFCRPSCTMIDVSFREDIVAKVENCTVTNFSRNYQTRSNHRSRAAFAEKSLVGFT